MKDCERCREYRSELRRNGKALAALVPIGPLAALAHAFSSEARHRRSQGRRRRLGRRRRAAPARRPAAGTGGAAVGGAAAAGGGGLASRAAEPRASGGALGAKAAAGMASMALLTAGAVEVNDYYQRIAEPHGAAAIEREATVTIGPADPRSDGSDRSRRSSA